ncbi:MAG: hypothetical protein LBI39_03265 [Puniceicoccales bacterium]|nr:hypothetical protein [Puniceicoccales bacterium]
MQKSTALAQDLILLSGFAKRVAVENFVLDIPQLTYVRMADGSNNWTSFLDEIRCRRTIGCAAKSAGDHRWTRHRQSKPPWARTKNRLYGRRGWFNCRFICCSTAEFGGSDGPPSILAQPKPFLAMEPLSLAVTLFSPNLFSKSLAWTQYFRQKTKSAGQFHRCASAEFGGLFPSNSFSETLAHRKA